MSSLDSDCGWLDDEKI
ncbi:hypothetical protein A2U01_0062387, partial [Trifolium medium]|nr:hypothetical protein [Trifolium medium]